MNKVVKSVFILLAFFISGCASNNFDAHELKVREILNGLELPENVHYEYSPESEMKIGDVTYSLRSRAIYNQNGHIQKVIVYKPEGTLEYNQEDISNDLLLLEYLGFPIRQDWRLTDNALMDINGNNIANTVRVNGSIYKTTDGQLTVLYLIE